MASPVLGVDLGTTNSVVAYADSQRVRVLRDDAGRLLTASTVSFHPSGQILIGEAARERRLVDAENTIFSTKRLIGRPYRSPEVRRATERLPFKLEEGATGGVMVRARGELYSLPEISSFVLREVRSIAEQALGQSCVNAVVTVPASFNELQRMATRDAGRIAGLNVLRILNEPTAAALAYGYRANQNQRIAVYDLGGGTFDVSVLELSGDVIEVIATAGDTYLGGDDIDRLIADRMVAEFLAKHYVDIGQDRQVYERVRMAAEWVKCQLSMLEHAEATVKEVAYGSGGAPLDLVFRFSRSDLDQLIQPLIARTFDICEDALKLAGVRPSQLDGVILVGGQTRTPKVRDMVGEYFAMEPQSSVDPDLVVAQGAALQGLALSSARVDGSRSRTKTLSGPPSPVRPDNARVSVAPPAHKSLNDTFDDEPTRVATRSDPPLLPADTQVTPLGENPFDEAATTISPRAQGTPDAEGVDANPLKSTLMGVGATKRLPPPVPGSISSSAPAPTSPPAAAGVSGMPKPPPLAAVMQNARQSAQAPAPAAKPSAASPAPNNLANKTLAETPGAKQGLRPATVPPPAARVTPLIRTIADDSVSVPRAGRVPSDIVSFDLAGFDEVTEEDLPLEAKAALTPSKAPAPLPATPPSAAVSAPRTRTVPETPKTKAAERVSLAPPTAAPAAAPAKPSVVPPSDAPSLVPRAAAASASAAPSARSAPLEPIRTPSMARLLAKQGHTERALSIYEELVKQSPGDVTLAREAAELRRALANPTPAAAPAAAKPVAAPLNAPLNALSSPAPPMTAPMTTPPPPQNTPSSLPAPAASRSQFPAPQRQMSSLLLLDVTPHTLCIETAGGFCEQVIERNAPIPTEQTRVLSTSQDNQVMVSMRICQGEARRTEDNQVLGQIELFGLRPARRGEVSIAVTFILGVDGTLDVRAQDRTTGQAQAIRVNLVGALDPGDIVRLRERAQAAAR